MALSKCYIMALVKYVDQFDDLYSIGLYDGGVKKKKLEQTASSISKKGHMSCLLSLLLSSLRTLSYSESTAGVHIISAHTRKEAEQYAWRRKKQYIKDETEKKIRLENVTNTFPMTTCDMTDCRFDAVELHSVFMFQPLFLDQSKYSGTLFNYSRIQLFLP